MRIIQLSSAPFGYKTITVWWSDSPDAVTVHVPPYVAGGQTGRWIEQNLGRGRKVRAWRPAF